jgi:serine/threonine protein phosphatase 1
MGEAAAIEPGERIYAIGDVHGRLDLLADLLGMIRRDQAGRPEARVRVILLGDVVDRGPDSAEIVRRLMSYTRASNRFVVLKGNHEQMMVESVQGAMATMQAWLGLGGVATLKSWGVAADVLAEKQIPPIAKAARKVVSDAELRWLDERPLTYASGDYLFVHAGIRPGVPLADQHPGNLLWIREPFLSWDGPHPAFIVHGHSARSERPEFRGSRVGLDTGAFRTGKLTALGLEGGRRWLLATNGPRGPAA